MTAAPPSNSPSALAVLRAYPLFGALPGPVLATLLPEMRAVAFEAGTLLVREGEPVRELVLIVEGQAERSETGVHRPSCIGPLEVVGQEAAGLEVGQSNVRALSQVIGWAIPAHALTRLCAQAPGMAAVLTHSLTRPEAQHKATRPWHKPPPPARGPSNKVLAGWALTLVLPPILFAMSSLNGLSLQASIFVAILGMVITMWVFSVVDDFIPPLIALICVLFVGLAPASVVLSSFASPSFLTLLSVFALAAMLTESGLSTRVLLWMLLRLPDGGPWRQALLLIYGLVLSISVSQINRMKLILPAFRDMCQGLRLNPGSAAVTATFAGAYGGAMLFSSAFATGKAATISAIGLLPTHQQVHITGLYWISAAALSTVLLAVIHFVSVSYQFRDKAAVTIDRTQIAERLALIGPLSLSEKVTALAFIIFIAASLSTSVHQIAPAAVAGTALIMLLVTGAMSRANFQSSIDWPMIVFLISVDCLIRVLDYLGLGPQLSAALSGASLLVQGKVLNFLVLSLAVVILLRLLVPIPAGVMLSAVVLLPIAQSEGISVWICLFAIAVFSDLWFFRYQNSIYVTGADGAGQFQIDEPSFMRHNQVMNFARVGVVFGSLPLWKWMGLA